MEIFGKSVSVERFANICGTISYEISSKIGKRVKEYILIIFDDINEFSK